MSAKKKADRRPWCWAESEDAENWFGPFASREKAINDAEGATYFDGDSIVVSRCNYPDPQDAVDAWVDYLEPLEALHDHTDDDKQDYENGETYEYRGDGEKAKKALADVITAWVAKYVKARWFQCDPDVIEQVDLENR